MSTGEKRLKNTILEDLTAPPPPPPPTPTPIRPPGKLFSEEEAQAIARSAAEGTLASGETEEEASRPAGKKRRGPSRSGTRQKPYERDDGTLMIKQSFHASEAFDRLWRKLPGALPRGTNRNAWAEKVLTKAIRAQLERGESE